LPEVRPRQILDAALAVFGKQGLAAAKVDEIADKAGISKGTVYLYFPSKEDLFREVVRSTWVEMLDSIAAVAETRDARADLESTCMSFWLFLRSASFATAHRLVMSEIQSFPDIAREFAEEVRQPILETLGAIIERGVAGGDFTPGDNVVRARMLFSLLLQHGVWCARRQVLPDLRTRSDDDVIREVLDFFLDATAVR
jgi:AcrR family transcriptional regulator